MLVESAEHSDSYISLFIHWTILRKHNFLALPFLFTRDLVSWPKLMMGWWPILSVLLTHFISTFRIFSCPSSPKCLSQLHNTGQAAFFYQALHHNTIKDSKLLWWLIFLLHPPMPQTPVMCRWNSCQTLANELDLGVPTVCQVGSAELCFKREKIKNSLCRCMCIVST